MQLGSNLPSRFKLSSKAPSDLKYRSIVHLRVTHNHRYAANAVERRQRPPSRWAPVVSAQSEQQAQQSHIELYGEEQSAAVSVLREAATASSVPPDHVTGAIAHLGDNFFSTNGEGELRNATECVA